MARSVSGLSGAGWKASVPSAAGQAWNNCRLMARTSSDHGMTWTADHEFLEAEIRGVPRNPTGSTRKWKPGSAGGRDRGEIEGSTFLIGSGSEPERRKGGFTAGGSQPAVIERKDGSLFALMRSAAADADRISRRRRHVEQRDRDHAAQSRCRHHDDEARKRKSRRRLQRFRRRRTPDAPPRVTLVSLSARSPAATARAKNAGIGRFANRFPCRSLPCQIRWPTGGKTAVCNRADQTAVQVGPGEEACDNARCACS